MSRKIRSIFLILLSAALAVCMGISAVAIAAGSAQPDYATDTADEYCLVLTDYTIKNYTEKVVVYDPNNRRMKLEGSTFRLLSCGVYTIDYGNGKMLFVRSLLEIPSVEFAFSEQLESEYPAGQILAFPEPVITNRYQRLTDYEIRISLGDTLKKTLSCRAGKQGSYFLAESGNYAVEYAVTDDFGKTYTETFSFSVADRPAVFSDRLPRSATFGDTVRIGFPYGFYLGELYPVTVTLTEPNGTQSICYAPDYTFRGVGDYIFRYDSTVNGEALTSSQTVRVTSEMSPFTFTDGRADTEEDVPLPEFTQKFAESLRGTEIRSDSDHLSFVYNRVIDLNTLTKEDNLIEFLPYSSGADSYVGFVRVSLTDVYDSSNVVSVYFRPCLDDRHHSYGILEFSGISAGICNDPGVKYGKVLNVLGTTFYNSTFFGDVYGESRTFSLQYDVTENAMYTWGRNNQYEFNRQLMMDLDSNAYVDLEYLFRGFSTGEVFLGIELIGNRNAGIYITEIAGEPVSVAEKLDDVMIAFDGYRESLPKGAVGYHYELPVVRKSFFCDMPGEIEKSLLFEGQEASNLLSEGGFTPDRAGIYTVIYNLNYKGTALERRLRITVAETPAEIHIGLPEGETIGLGEVYMLPEFSISGGSGKLASVVEVTLNGELLEKQASGGYLVSGSGEFKVCVTVTDEIGYQKTAEYTVEIRDGLVFEQKGVMPRALRVGEQFSLPDFTAIRVENSESVELTSRKIVVRYGMGGTLELSAPYLLTVPDCDRMTVEYIVTEADCETALKSYEIEVLSANIEKSADLFSYDPGLTPVTLESGVVFTAQEGDFRISAPNLISAQNLFIRFVVNDNAFGCGSFEVMVTDASDSVRKLILAFKNYNSTKGTIAVSVNGGTETFEVLGTRSTYSTYCGDAAAIEKYAGTGYTSFEIFLDSEAGILRNSTTNSVAAYLESWENGVEFKGFPEQVCFLDFNIKGVADKTEIGIGAIANQQFRYTIEESGYEWHDNKGPEIVVFGNTQFYRAQRNENYRVGGAIAYDVIRSVSSAVTATLYAPDNTKVFEKREVAEGFDVKLDQYGRYRLVYRAEDSAGNVTEREVSLDVLDDIGPEITVQGSYAESYALDAELTIEPASCRDNFGSVTETVFLRTPSGLKSVKAGDKIELTERGSYQIIYRAEDESKNVSRKVFAFTV